MKDAKLVWSDEQGDLRKNKVKKPEAYVDLSKVQLKLRRLTSGKGRTMIEIKGLPENENWNKSLASELKQGLGVGGAYKKDYIEIHTDNVEKVTNLLDKKSIKWKKVGG
ncbi:MAG: hypothetical protein Fur0010_22550 [Bdellovibrio sp.]